MQYQIAKEQWKNKVNCIKLKNVKVLYTCRYLLVNGKHINQFVILKINNNRKEFMRKKIPFLAIMIFSIPSSIYLSMLKAGNIDNGEMFSCVYLGVILFFLCLLSLFNFNKIASIILETLSFCLFITLAIYCLTILFIGLIMSYSASYDFLYYPRNFADIIFWTYLALGAFITVLIIKYSLRELHDSKYNHD